MLRRSAAALAALVLLVGLSACVTSEPSGPSGSSDAGATSPRVTAVTDTTVTVSWSTVPDADGYRVDRDAAGGESGPWSTTDPASATSREFTYLTTGAAYTFTVQALPDGPVESVRATPGAGLPSSPSTPSSEPSPDPEPAPDRTGRNPSGLPELGFSLNGETLSGPLSQAHYDELGEFTPAPVWGRVGFSTDGDWRKGVDEYVSAIRAAGMKVLLRASFPTAEHHGRQPVDAAAYGDFVGDLAAHVQAMGLGPDDVVFEYPNELNATKVSAADFVAAAREAYPKLKAVDPGYRIIGASENVYKSGWATWLEQAYRAGYADVSDGVSFHNYDVAGDHDKYDRLRDIMTRYDDLDAMVWLTEFGTSTPPNPSGRPLGGQTEEAQAERLVANLRDVGEHFPWITHAFIYADEDVPPRKKSDPHEGYFGIYRNDANGTITGEKPAVEAIKELYRG